MKCDVLTKEMLSPEKIRSTAEKIKHNLQVIHLLEDGQNLRLCEVINDLSNLRTHNNESFMGIDLTKMRTAYNLHFKLKTLLVTGNDFSAEGVEVKTLAKLLELLESDDNISLKRTDYHVIIDDEILSVNTLSELEKYKALKELANQEVADLIQQTVFLNIGLDIQKKSEIKMTIMKDRFRQNYASLVEQVTLQQKFLNSVLEAAKSGVDAQGYFNANNRAVLIATLKSSKLDTNVRQNLVDSLNSNLEIDVWDVLIDALAKVQLDAEGWRILIDAITTTDFSSGNGKGSPKLNTSGYHRVKEILDALNKTSDELAKAKSRPIRIGVMGTRNSGKSVVINDFLRRDFAPTSLELATPNTVKYIPDAPGKKLTLDYSGKSYEFDTDELLKSFIGREFDRADKETGEGSALADMTIHYPCDNLTGYEIWDTPGPDYAVAGNYHLEIAKTCIREVDICIFVMDYSHGLTTYAVEFLKSIYETFKENNKFYSLFITVNKTDLIYVAEVEKSVNRALDYISKKLNEIGYRDTVIFGTSALQNFYLDKVIALAKADGATNKPFINADVMNQLRSKHHNADAITKSAIKFVRHTIEDLYDFHDILNATEKELEAFSGMPQLLRYTQYIGQSKADMEIVNRVIGNCEGQFTIVKSALGVTEYEELSDEAKRYLEAVLPKVNEMNKLAGGIKDKIENVIGGMETIISAQDEAKRQAKSIENQSKQQFVAEVDLAMKKWSVNEENIKTLRNDAEKESNKAFMNGFLNSVDNVFQNTAKEARQSVELLVETMSIYYSDEIKNELQKLSLEIASKVNEINTSLHKAGIPEIVLPNFPVNVQIKPPNVKFNPEAVLGSGTLKKAAENAVMRFNRTGFFSRFTNWLLGPKEKISVETFKKNVSEQLKHIGNEQIVNVFANLNNQIYDEINKNFMLFYEDCQETQEIYQKIFKNTFRNILEVLIQTGADIEEIRRNIDMLKKIDNQMQVFFGIWRNIRMEDE